MSRISRQSKILEIIANNQVETQEELVDRLRSQGLNVTQATISRDIKELNLIKTLTGENRYKYVAMQTVDSKLSARLASLFRDAVVSVASASNLVVVKTLHNSAQAVATIVEQLNLHEVLGVVDGSNSILIVTSSAKDASLVAERLSAMQD